MNLRKLFFWLHLIVGIAAGIVILVMSATGVLLTYEKQIILWMDGDLLKQPAPSAETQRLPIKTLLAKARDAGDGAVPASIAFYSASAAAAVTTSAGTVYIDAYDGSVVGTGSTSTRAFFRKVTDWHRYLALSGESRPAGKSVTGAANLLFLFVIGSGAYLWFRGAVLWFKKGLRGKALYWNWHNVFGLWASVPLFLVVLSATVISYPWASNLVYRIAGSQPPAQSEGRRGTQAGGNASSFTFEDIEFGRADFALAHAGVQAPDWRTITMRVPASAEAVLSFTVDSGNGGQPQHRATLTVDRDPGKKARLEGFDDQDAGRRARSWLRFMHTGEYYGLAGQTIAGIASFAGVVLVVTGFVLSFKRFSAWRQKAGSL